MVKARQPSAVELAKAVSQPMLVIPQPILHTHKFLTNVRMAQIESNSYIALGIKEEPVDYEEESNNGEQYDFESELGCDDGDDETVSGRVRTRQQYSKMKQQELVKEKMNFDDANNNESNLEMNSTLDEQISQHNTSQEPPVDKSALQFHAFEKPSIMNPDDVLSTLINPTNVQMEENVLVTQKQEVTEHLDANPSVKEPARKKKTNKDSNLDINLNQEKPAEDNNNLDANANLEKLAEGIQSIEDNENVKNNVNDQLTIEEDLGLYSSSSSEDSEDFFPKLWILTDEERQSLVCNVCKKKFSRVSILTAHKKKHFDPKTYKCSHCNKIFSSESSYKHHIAYSGLAPYKCDRCQKSYYTEQKCASHKEQCKGKNTERKFHCEDCGRSYVMLCSLRTHIRERHSDFQPVKNLCCELCGKRFRHRKYLELHKYSHSTEKNFECTICQRRYKSSDILRHHVRMVHANPPKATCTICAKEVSRVSLKAHLNRHREKEQEEKESARNLVHLAADGTSPNCQICRAFFENDKLLEMHCCAGSDGSFTCPHCDDSFPEAVDLVQHTCQGLNNSKCGNTVKVYQCVFCRREYNCHTPWLYHVRHHTGDKPYPCTQCDKSFRLKQGLKVHMRNHTGEKPFKCDQCPAAFKQKPFLLDHINTHTGEKPYQCERCLSRFSVRSALSTHKRIHRREFLNMQNDS